MVFIINKHFKKKETTQKIDHDKEEERNNNTRSKTEQYN